nr:LysR substrate-binding domain-containing protein [Paenibacillus polymyxa]
MICRIPSLLVEYRQMYPKVNLSLKSLDYQDVSHAVQTGEIDFLVALEKEGWGANVLRAV